MLTRKNILLCEALAQGKSGAEAERYAGYKEQGGKYAYELQQKQEITIRIKELQAEIQKKYAVTKDKLIKDLFTLRDNTDNDTVKARCIELIAKMTGNLKDNVTQFSQLIVKPTEADMKQKLGDILKKGRGTPTDED